MIVLIKNQAMQFLSYSSSCLAQYINTVIDNTVVGWGDTGIHTDNYNHFDNYNHTESDNDNNNQSDNDNAIDIYNTKVESVKLEKVSISLDKPACQILSSFQALNPLKSLWWVGGGVWWWVVESDFSVTLEPQA